MMRITTLLPVLIAAAALGCGSGPGALYGTVKKGSVTLKRGTVTVFNDKGFNATGEIQEDGTYRVEGCPSGKVKITVQTWSVEEEQRRKTAQSQGRTKVPSSSDPIPTPPAPEAPLIAPKHSDPDQTELTTTISGDTEFDIVVD